MFFNIYVLITLVLSYMSAPCAGFITIKMSSVHV